MDIESGVLYKPPLRHPSPPLPRTKGLNGYRVRPAFIINLNWGVCPAFGTTIYRLYIQIYTVYTFPDCSTPAPPHSNNCPKNNLNIRIQAKPATAMEWIQQRMSGFWSQTRIWYCMWYCTSGQSAQTVTTLFSVKIKLFLGQCAQYWFRLKRYSLSSQNVFADN